MVFLNQNGSTKKLLFWWFWNKYFWTISVCKQKNGLEQNHETNVQILFKVIKHFICRKELQTYLKHKTKKPSDNKTETVSYTISKPSLLLKNVISSLMISFLSPYTLSIRSNLFTHALSTWVRRRLQFEIWTYFLTHALG